MFFNTRLYDIGNASGNFTVGSCVTQELLLAK